ncbi:uncharacterized protein LOC113799697 [Dermatophagoides pteronyssinus]|uniref:uncharacterized protein LOC113799697 n=1 Tax=Dermatophagoides pteronyssinus TaxID=6956 RepID=UPI003F67A28A
MDDFDTLMKYRKAYKDLLLGIKRMSLDDNDELLKDMNGDDLLQRWIWIKRARKLYNQILSKLCDDQIDDKILEHYIQTRLTLEKMAIRTYCFLEQQPIIISDHCFEMFNDSIECDENIFDDYENNSNNTRKNNYQHNNYSSNSNHRNSIDDNNEDDDEDDGNRRRDRGRSHDDGSRSRSRPLSHSKSLNVYDEITIDRRSESNINSETSMNGDSGHYYHPNSNNIHLHQPHQPLQQRQQLQQQQQQQPMVTNTNNHPIYPPFILQPQISMQITNQNVNSYFQSPIIRTKYQQQQQQQQQMQRPPYNFDMSRHLMAIECIMIEVKNMANIHNKSIEFRALGIDFYYFEKIIEKMFKIIGRDYWPDESIQNLAKFLESLDELPVNPQYCSQNIRIIFSRFRLIKFGSIVTYFFVKDLENLMFDHQTSSNQQTNFAMDDNQWKIYTITLIKLIAHLYRMNMIDNQVIIYLMNKMTFILNNNDNYDNIVLPSEFKMDCFYLMMDTMGLNSIKRLFDEHNRNFNNNDPNLMTLNLNEIFKRLYDICMTADESKCYSKHTIIRLRTIIDYHQRDWQ